MPETTPILSLPLIQPAQAQKHIPHNEAIAAIEALVHLSVKDRHLANAPASPVAGDRYLVAAAPTGAWAGQAGRVALFDGSAWRFFAPLSGWRMWIEDEQALLAYDGAAWVSLLGAQITADRIGVSATPDTTNRLSVNSPAVLFNHAGGDMELTLNKAALGDDAALAFKQAFSARALMGLLASEDFAIKVSPDGSAYFNAIVIDRASGALSLAAPLRLEGQSADPASPANGMIWTHQPSGEVRVRSAGQTVAIAPNALSDGDKGDVTFAANLASARVNPAVKYGLSLALGQQIFFN